MRKIIVLPGASPDYCERFAKNLTGTTDDFVLTHDIKLYDIDEAVLCDDEYVKKWLEGRGITQQKNRKVKN